MAMVSKYDDKHFLFVRQIDHSEVVGFFAAHWGNDVFERPRPWNSMVLAATEHDKGWTEWEMKPTLNAEGHPIDYQGSGLGQHGFHARNVDRVMAVDPYAGLVNLMHNVGLLNAGYGLMLPEFRSREDEPGAKAFIEKYEAIRPELTEKLRSMAEFTQYATDEHIWENYHLMEIFDLMGQYFCNRYPLTRADRPRGPHENLRNVTAPLRYGGEQTKISIDIVDDFRAVIDPWPFDVDPLVISFPGRLLSLEPYKSQDEFLLDYYAGPRVTIEYTLMYSA